MHSTALRAVAPSPGAGRRQTTMKAIVHAGFGLPNGLQLGEVPRPEPTENEVLVRVHAAGLNRLDWYGATGTPYIGRPRMGLRKPGSPKFGVDFAGTVEAVGKDVPGFRPGDGVFGIRDGALAEFVCASAALAHKPVNVSFDEAATVAAAGVTALQGLRDKAQLEPGQRVLINGAAGGVGTFSVQVAKALGAEVTGVCSTRNVELVRSIGADHAIDYTKDDFTRTGERYDVLLDVAGNRSWRAMKRVLAPDATLVLVGGPKNRVLGPLGHIARVHLAALRSSRKVVFFIAKPNPGDLQALAELMETGKLKPVIERRYRLDEVVEALEYLGTGHVQGKLVVTVSAA